MLCTLLYAQSCTRKVKGVYVQLLLLRPVLSHVSLKWPSFRAQPLGHLLWKFNTRLLQSFRNCRTSMWMIFKVLFMVLIWSDETLGFRDRCLYTYIYTYMDHYYSLWTPAQRNFGTSPSRFTECLEGLQSLPDTVSREPYAQLSKGTTGLEAKAGPSAEPRLVKTASIRATTH